MKRRDHKKESKMALETLIFSNSQVKVNGAPASSTTTTISGSDQLTMSFNLDLKPTDVVFEARLLFCKNSATNPGAFAGSALTDLIDSRHDFSEIDWGKAALSGVFAFGLSWFGNAVTWGGGRLSVAAQFALSYDYALIGLSNSIINVFWRGKKKW